MTALKKPNQDFIFQIENTYKTIRNEDVANTVHRVRLRMKEDQVPGQFEDLEFESEPPVKISRFDEIDQIESIDYAEQDGYALLTVLHYYSVKGVMEKSEIDPKEMENTLTETLIRLKKSGKTEFDVFQTQVYITFLLSSFAL